MSVKFLITQSDLSLNTENTRGFVQEYLYEDGLFSVGSSDSNNIVVNNIASEQIIISKENDQLVLINRGDGTLLNGKELSEEAIEAIKDGDKIQIGDCFISIKDEEKENVSNSRSFADILSDLQSDEDRYYLLSQKNEKFFFDTSEISFGLDKNGDFLFDEIDIKSLIGTFYKNWQGITFSPIQSFYLNDQLQKTAIKLKNGDRLSFGKKRARNKSFLVLHEPSLIVALESILEPKEGAEDSQANQDNSKEITKSLKKINSEKIQKYYFGYFSFFEITLIFLAAIIGIAIIFITLELAFI